MRILFLDQFSHFGGAQLCLRDVLAEVRRRGWDAEAMAPGNGPLLEFALECGFDCETLPIPEYSTHREASADFLRFGSGLARAAVVVRRALRKRSFDAVYVNGPRVLPAVIQRKTPVIFHAHSVATTKYTRMIVNWSLRRIRATALACSKFAASPIREALGGRAAQIVYNGVADCGFRPRSGEHHGTIRVGLLGRVSPEKGHLDFLHAARALAGDPNLRFVVVGAALFSDRGYEQKIRSLCAESRVESRGWTDDVPEALHDLDILAVPSGANEASTRVVMEALSAGACVVAYPSGGLPELIRNRFSGLLIDARSPAELADAIRSLARNPEMRSRLARNGRKEWEARFTVERFQREVCDRIEAVARSRALAASESRIAPAESRFGHDARPASRERPLTRSGA